MRALILSDIHANYAALKAVLDAEPRIDEIFCLGDIVLFGPNPSACVDLIRARADKVVQGNHDAETVDFCRRRNCQGTRTTNADLWKTWTGSQLSGDQIKYLASLPEEIEMNLDGYNVLIRHDFPLSGDMIMPDTPTEQIEVRLDKRDFNYLFVGHTHVPYIKKVGNRHIVNVGSVGQPEHGDGQASYALWTDGKVTLHKSGYDIETTISDLKKIHLSEEYAELWCDFWRNGHVNRKALEMLEQNVQDRRCYGFKKCWD